MSSIITFTHDSKWNPSNRRTLRITSTSISSSCVPSNLIMSVDTQTSWTPSPPIFPPVCLVIRCDTPSLNVFLTVKTRGVSPTTPLARGSMPWWDQIKRWKIKTVRFAVKTPVTGEDRYNVPDTRYRDLVQWQWSWSQGSVKIVVYYEWLKRELKTKTIHGFRCDERLKKLNLRNLHDSDTLGGSRFWFWPLLRNKKSQ